MKKVPLRRPKVVIFDVDKTLTEHNSWYELTEALHGDPVRHAELYVQYRQGAISYEQARTGLMAMLTQEGKRSISRKELADIFLGIALRPEAIATARELQDHGYELCLISSSIDVFVEIVARRLGVDHWYANSVFEFDANDNWIDFQYNKDEAGLKVKQLEGFLQEQGLTMNDVIAIGDGDSDVELFKVIPGVAVHSDYDHLIQLAWEELKYLPKLIQLLESLPE